MPPCDQKKKKIKEFWLMGVVHGVVRPPQTSHQPPPIFFVFSFF
jgi:hypothetical protein